MYPLKSEAIAEVIEINTYQKKKDRIADADVYKNGREWGILYPHCECGNRMTEQEYKYVGQCYNCFYNEMD